MQTSAPAPIGPRINFDLSAGNWKQHGRGLPDAGAPVRSRDGLGIVTDLLWSAKPDPDAGPNWNGYLVYEIDGNMQRAPSPKPNNAAWNAANPQPLLPAALSLDPKKRLVYEFSFGISEGAQLNYQSDANNTDKTVLAGFRPFITADGLTSNRWWNKQHWTLEKTDGVFILDVPLDPSNWFDVTGSGADVGMNGQPRKDYLDALARPMYIGLTFGGGFFAGHGVCVSNGNAQLSLSAFYTY